MPHQDTPIGQTFIADVRRADPTCPIPSIDSIRERVINEDVAIVAWRAEENGHAYAKDVIVIRTLSRPYRVTVGFLRHSQWQCGPHFHGGSLDLENAVKLRDELNAAVEAMEQAAKAVIYD